MRTTWSWSRTSSKSSVRSHTGARRPKSLSASSRSLTSRSGQVCFELLVFPKHTSTGLSQQHVTVCCECLWFRPQSLLETHDSVASKNYETPPPSPCSFMDAALNNQPVPPDAVRMVGIRKVSGEHLVGTHKCSEMIYRKS